MLRIRIPLPVAGCKRLGSKEYRQFVGIARGSAGEVCYQLLLARALKYISTETYQELRSAYDRINHSNALTIVPDLNR